MNILLIKFKALVKITALYKNWPAVIFTRLPILKKPKIVVYQLRNGLKIIVRPADIVEARVIDNTFLGEYSQSGFEIKPQDTVIDIGAHIGSFTLLAGLVARKGRVIAFEPSSYNFSQLEKNIKLNNFNNVEIYKSALSGKSGYVNLYPSEGSSAHFSLFLNNPKFEKVKAVTLTDIFKKFKISHCDFLKIDAEGAEFEILTTTPASILKLIDKIVFEFHPRAKDRERLDKILAILSVSGFKLVTQKQGIFFLKRS